MSQRMLRHGHTSISNQWRRVAVLTAIYCSTVAHHVAASSKIYPTASGILPWVDPETPANRQTYKSSRGDVWTLIMSDEFNTPNRSFEPGDDHLWTSIEKADGVNAALEIYSKNMTTTVCDDDDTCYFQIKIIDEVTNLTTWNDYSDPPGYQESPFYYRAGMMQSWNKFCFQGGMVEVRAQLPGAVTEASGNPDIATGKSSARCENLDYYPTWPGIWLMGNLGRAIFSASTNRMWPFSYNECNDDVFDSSNQRISACNDNPGHGLNSNQGRGAPEIDILEGGGVAISSSIQVGPGMPADFRLIDPESTNEYCLYSLSCKTEGANTIDVPTAYYESIRDHLSWYQGLKYAANNFCTVESDEIQDYDTVKASLDAGITENACSTSLCSASMDPHADLSLMEGSTTDRWGINSNGTCYPVNNAYKGAILCSPGNNATGCDGKGTQTESTVVFSYQMDAISSNWPVHVGAYTGYLIYQVEWVTGSNGYVRWMLAGEPIFEIPASTIEDVPQDSSNSNPKKIMLEEPMYIIFNVALSSSWGSKPPNAGEECRGDGTNEKVNAICDSFPMYLKIDYIRVYQDISDNSTMAYGCDPSTHPTKQWIEDHIDEYTDDDNPAVEVSGKAFCQSNNDCTISSTLTTDVITGTCVNNRCSCRGSSWSGPRCTATLATTENDSDSDTSNSYGPPFTLAVATAGLTFGVTVLAVFFSVLASRKRDSEFKRQVMVQPKPSSNVNQVNEILNGVKPTRDEYSTNFV